MGSNHLGDFIENAEDLARDLIPELQAGKLDRKGISALCFSFRQHGVCTLLQNNAPDVLYLRAMQSAGAYLSFLGFANDDQKVTSEARPFLDAVGCGYWDAATEIARASRRTWNEGCEYEEDFLFVLFLMEHFFLGAPVDRSRAIIDEHERVTEGEDRAHREVCTALLERDSALFHSSLTDLLAERKERVEAMVRRDAMPEEHWSWLRYFSLEGWALLKLAERQGMQTALNYLHVPRAIRKPSPLVFDSDAWRSFAHRM